jgi:HEAT repeat protein
MTSRAATIALTNEQQQRISEVRRLSGKGEPGVSELVALLDDTSWAVRREVVATLAAEGSAAVPPLARLLREQRDNEARIAAAVDALAATSADVFDAMRELAESDDPAVVADAAQVLGRRRNMKYVPLLASLVNHVNDNVAVAAIEGLGRIGGAGGVEALAQAAASGNFFRMFPAIDVLGRSKDPRAVAPLSALLGDPTYTLEAARALGRTGEIAAVVPLAAMLARPSESAVRVAAVALAELHAQHGERYGTSDAVEESLRSASPGPSAERRLMASLNAADRSEQVAIAFVLGTLGSEAGTAALLMLLDAEPGVAKAAAAALRKLGKRAEPQQREALRAGASSRRQALLPLVSTLGAIPEVALCLTDGDASVRALACDALGRLGATSAVPSVFPLLDDPNARVVQAAIGAIQSLGSREASKLALAAAGSDKPTVRRAALRILAYFGDDAALPVFLRALDDADPRVRDTALGGLAVLEDAAALDALLEAARSPSAGTRSAAIRALGRRSQSDDRARACLLAALGDAEPWVRYYACQALGRLRAEGALVAIVPLLGDPAGQVRVAAIEAISHFRTPAASRALIQAVSGEDADVRRAALVGLGFLALPDVLPTLREAAASPDPATRLVAVSALAHTDSPESLPLITRAARDPDENVRTAALGCLAALGSKEATGALLDLLDDASDRAQVSALLSIPTPGRVPGIVAALESADDALAPLLTSALARLRTRESTAALFEAMTLTSVPARKAAASALASLRTQDAWDTLRRAADDDTDPQVRGVCAVLVAR